MATISSTIKMVDHVTQPVQRIIKNVNKAITVIERFRRLVKITLKKGFAKATIRVLLDTTEVNRQLRGFKKQADSELGQITARIRIDLSVQLEQMLMNLKQLAARFISATSQLQVSIGMTRPLESSVSGQQQRGGGSAGKSKDPIKDLQSFTSSGEVLNKIVYGGMEQQNMLDLFIDKTQNVEVGTAMFEKFRQDAYRAGAEVGEYLQYALGSISPAAEQDGFENTMSTLRQIDMFINRLNAAFGEVGMAALQGLLPIFTTLNEEFQSGKFQPFFDVLSNGFEWAATKARELFTDVMAVSGFIADNWGTIGPIIWGVAGAIGVWTIMTNIQTLATTGLSTAWSRLSAAIKANVFIFIISLVIGLITWFINLWQTNDQFAAGLMRVWNSILNFFDRIPIFFVKVGYGIVNALQDMKVWSLTVMDSLINGVIDGINWLLQKSNDFLGTNFEIIGHVGFAVQASKKADEIRKAGEKTISKMEDDYAKNVAKREQNVQDSMNNREADRIKEQMDNAKSKGMSEDAVKKWNDSHAKGPGKIPGQGPSQVSGISAQNINRVNEVGKINDQVEISSEDLKSMRELAEMKNIQNFVSLTPTVQVKTGDIKNGYDVDTMISRITTTLSEQVASSAKGVYG